MDLKIRIPAHIWNAYVSANDQPKPTRRSRRSHILRLPPTKSTELKIRIPAHIWNAYTLENDGPKTRERRKVSRALRSCKIKLFRFHYGGVARKQRGKYKNDISYEQPCLRPTCASCLEWHPQMVWEGLGMRASKSAKPLEKLATSGAPARMTRSMSIKQQRIVQLSFVTQRGKNMFRTLVQRYERRERWRR